MMMCKDFLHVCYYGDTTVVLWQGNPLLFSPHQNSLLSPLPSSFCSFVLLCLCLIESFPMSLLPFPLLFFMFCFFSIISLNFLVPFHLLSSSFSFIFSLFLLFNFLSSCLLLVTSVLSSPFFYSVPLLLFHYSSCVLSSPPLLASVLSFPHFLFFSFMQLYLLLSPFPYTLFISSYFIFLSFLCLLSSCLLA